MKLGVRSLFLPMAMACVTIGVEAQNATPSKADVDRCTDWMKAVVPENLKVDAAPFCAGLKQEQDPNLGGWFGTFYCGPSSKSAKEGKGPYCASSGAMNLGYSVAIGFKSESGKAGDLMPPEDGGAGIPATLYTRTPLQMGSLRLPAGFFQFTLAHPAEGWQMVVSRENGSALGVVPLKVDGETRYTGSGMALSVHHSGFHCPDPVNVHEFVFSYQGRDLYTCFQPSRVEQPEQTAAAQ